MRIHLLAFVTAAGFAAFDLDLPIALAQTVPQVQQPTAIPTPVPSPTTTPTSCLVNCDTQTLLCRGNCSPAPGGAGPGTSQCILACGTQELTCKRGCQ